MVAAAKIKNITTFCHESGVYELANQANVLMPDMPMMSHQTERCGRCMILL